MKRKIEFWSRCFRIHLWFSEINLLEIGAGLPERAASDKRRDLAA
jgi:hypothetical protein